jgi:biopolymer transport protein ExbD
MSETRNNFGRKSITPKTKKLHPRVDLTAMVSVSFLLIIFFMLTSYLSKPSIMDLGMPEKRVRGCCDCLCFLGEPRTITLLLGDNNKIVSYFESYHTRYNDSKVLSYDKNSLRKELITKNQQIVQQTGDHKKGLIVLIKPSKQSNYGNLVNILDEMAITKVRTYAVVDITPEEENLLVAK